MQKNQNKIINQQINKKIHSKNAGLFQPKFGSNMDIPMGSHLSPVDGGNAQRLQAAK